MVKTNAFDLLLYVLLLMMSSVSDAQLGKNRVIIDVWSVNCMYFGVDRHRMYYFVIDYLHCNDMNSYR